MWGVLIIIIWWWWWSLISSRPQQNMALLTITTTCPKTSQSDADVKGVKERGLGKRMTKEKKPDSQG
jgi:hypothetical protein